MSSNTATKVQEQAYDEMPYESHTYAQTHPQQMAVVATLFGLKPVDISTARVLELGCASGGNILPLALRFPKGHYVGIDISGEQIALANKEKAELGVKNIIFEQADITKFDLEANAGKFDYIICHGILSWVPDIVRNAIFELCDKCLSPNGLAVISYNTLPGWNAVRSLREMMLFHTRRLTSPLEKVQQARALLDFLLETVSDQRGAYKTLIEEERKLLSGTNDSYLFHDHMESENHQFYLNEFVAEATKHNLTYLGDSAYASMYLGNMPEKAREKLGEIPDIVIQEQYMDFINNRRFRTSILCKPTQTPNRNLTAPQIANFYISAILTLDHTKTNTKDSAHFISSNGTNFSTNGPAATALYTELMELSPRPMKIEEIAAHIAKKYNTNPDDVKNVLMSNGLELALRGVINISVESPEFVTTISEKPVAFPMARLQAKRNARSLTNVFGQMQSTDQLANMVIPLIDGTRTIGDLEEFVYTKVQDKTLNITKEGKVLTEDAAIREEIKTNMLNLLQRLAKTGGLVG